MASFNFFEFHPIFSSYCCGGKGKPDKLTGKGF